MIQVSLIDLDTVFAGIPQSLDDIAASMVGGVQRRRNHWEQTDTVISLDGVQAKRIKWSGTDEPSPERPPHQPILAMHGVMIVGIKGKVAFALHTQDVDPSSEVRLRAGEKALMSFALIAHR